MPATVVNVYRTRHWDISIMRPSVYGNPFSHLLGTRAKYQVGTREESIQRYREWLMEDGQEWLRKRMLLELRSKVLGCCCSPLDCHGRVIAEFVNEFWGVQ